MRITILERGMWGIDWPLIVATFAAAGTVLAAIFAYRLWKTAKDELGAVLATARDSSQAREQEIETLRRQLALAEQTRRDAMRPHVDVRFAKDAPTGGAHLIVGSEKLVLNVLNIGPGPALQVELAAWVIGSDHREPWDGTIPNRILTGAPNFAHTATFSVGATPVAPPLLRKTAVPFYDVDEFNLILKTGVRVFVRARYRDVFWVEDTAAPSEFVTWATIDLNIEPARSDDA